MPGAGCAPPKHGGCIKHSCQTKWGRGCVPASASLAGVSQAPGLAALQFVKLHTWGG